MNDQTNDDPKEMSAENKAENADDQSTDSPVVDEAETENDSASEEVSEVDLLAQLEAEVEKYKDLALRAEAEMQNLRRRAERDVQNAHKFGSERLLQNLLPVLDSLEKAIEPARRQDKMRAIRSWRGSNSVDKLFVDVLTREGIEALDPRASLSIRIFMRRSQ